MFAFDEHGKMTGSSPQFYLLRTANSVDARFHVALPDDVANRLQQIATGPRMRPSQWADEYAGYLSLLASVKTLKSIRSGQLYNFPIAMRSIENTVAIDKHNADLLNYGLQEWLPDVAAGVPISAAIADNRAVSICASAIASETAHSAGVETLPEYRGNGFALLAVTAWAEQVRSKRAVPFYATTFDNIASQRLANSLGLDLIGSEFTVY
ncbi:GNAT family N-acetyltransferase [Phyllobacterium sp. OV277]|uniref:GNAT family N-acetyltransferase n=1 Tax=Phyllobacterium sp. OV277 TaxID=1882772 RepID=UPI0015872198|nr:GNAT family N-acetyltransferase [Phyllobacterium sp. OV277]